MRVRYAGAIHGVCFVDKATAKSTGKELQRLVGTHPCFVVAMASMTNLGLPSSQRSEEWQSVVRCAVSPSPLLAHATCCAQRQAAGREDSRWWGQAARQEEESQF